MDMPMSGTPWLDQPVMLHSSREMPPCAMTAEQCAYKSGHWRLWYQADLVYALNTVYFAVALIAMFTAARLFIALAPKSWQRSLAYHKLLSVSRFLSYRSFRVKTLHWYSAPAGLLLLGMAGAVFFLGMTLGPKPYYWPSLPDGNSYGDSPPLATRAGWMAVALLPFVIAFPTKMNFITTATGVPHEKLQTFHRWSAYIMFILALVHTFPFIIHSIAVGDMVMNWRTSVFYWTGVVALLAQAWLTLFSNEYLRNRFYEIFKATHILAAVVFVVFFFLHCDYTLTSWDYFIAAGVLYFSSYLLAALRTFHEHGIRKATISLMPHGTIRIAMPSHADWSPGQHVFLRFPTMGLHHAITSHPFTICSLDTSSEMVMYVKPRAGLTRRLASLCSSRPVARIWTLVDGPYGGLPRQTLSGFDSNLIIAGGSGTGFVLPLVEDVLRRRCLDDRVTTELEVIVCTRELATAKWFKDEATALFRKYQAYGSEQTPLVTIHLTSEIEDDKEEKKLSDKSADLGVVAADDASQDSRYDPVVEVHRGRPALPYIIRNQAQRVAGSLAVAVCGPASMLFDVRNAAADVQADIMRSRTRISELYLHTEHFGL